jgi:hypothetical protein
VTLKSTATRPRRVVGRARTVTGPSGAATPLNCVSPASILVKIVALAAVGVSPVIEFGHGGQVPGSICQLTQVGRSPPIHLHHPHRTPSAQPKEPQKRPCGSISGRRYRTICM